MSIFQWLFGKKESPTETFTKAVPYELGLENAHVAYDAKADAGSVLGEAAERAWTFSQPTQVRVTVDKDTPPRICLHHTDTLTLTFALNANSKADAPVFDMAISPKRAATDLARGGIIHLGNGIHCKLADLDAVFELAGELLETHFPRFANGTFQSLSVEETQTTLVYAAGSAEGLVHKTLYDDARKLMSLLEHRRSRAKGERPFRPDETSEDFATKLVVVASTRENVATVHKASPKKRDVRFVVEGVPAVAHFTGTRDAARLQLKLQVGERDGSFFLHHDHQERDDGRPAEAWAESELRVFFAKNAFVSSTQTRAEVRFLVALPEATRDAIVALCTRFDCEIAFADGTLTVDFRELAQFLFYADRGRAVDAAEVLVAIAAELCGLSRSFPTRDPMAAPAAKDIPQLTGCKFCRALFFRSSKTTACVHCGAPAETAFHVATLEPEVAS